MIWACVAAFALAMAMPLLLIAIAIVALLDRSDDA